MARAETITIPAAIDPHFHGREPSPINKSETFASGSRAMMLGGFAVVIDMSNTPGRPTNDAGRVQEKHSIIEERAYVAMGTAAGAQPEDNNVGRLPDMAPLSAFLKSYLGKTTGNPNEYTAEDFFEIWEAWHAVTDKPIFVHRGSADLEAIIAKVAKELNHRLHICHTNSLAEVKLAKKAKRDELPVTIGVTPHHLFMTKHHVFSHGSFAKTMPPLAPEADTERLWYELVNGGIDLVETDHAPHPYEAKMEAERGNGECYGVPSGEFTQPLILRRTLYKEDGYVQMPIDRYVEVTSGAAQRLLNINLSPDTRATWEMTEFRYQKELPAGVESGAKWNPFLGMLAAGKLIRLQVGAQVLVNNTFETGEKVARVVTGQGEVV